MKTSLRNSLVIEECLNQNTRKISAYALPLHSIVDLGLPTFQRWLLRRIALNHLVIPLGWRSHGMRDHTVAATVTRHNPAYVRFTVLCFSLSHFNSVDGILHDTIQQPISLLYCTNCYQ